MPLYKEDLNLCMYISGMSSTVRQLRVSLLLLACGRISTA